MQMGPHTRQHGCLIRPGEQRLKGIAGQEDEPKYQGKVKVAHIPDHPVYRQACGLLARLPQHPRHEVDPDNLCTLLGNGNGHPAGATRQFQHGSTRFLGESAVEGHCLLPPQGLFQVIEDRVRKLFEIGVLNHPTWRISLGVCAASKMQGVAQR